MHRTTIMLPDNLKRLAAERAHRASVSIGELIRKALVRELNAGTAGEDAFLSDTRVFRGRTRRHVAERYGEHL